MCRRELGAVAVPDASEVNSSAIPWLLGVLVLVGTGGAVAWAMAGSPNVPPPMAAHASAPIAREPEPEKAPKPAEDELAASLRMLERAEADRLALERSLQEQDAQARAAAEAERKREEAERDAKRHEAVKRDLDATALAAARRNVSITMYSTSWCGVCKKARAYMEDKHIAFTEIDVDHDAAARTRARSLNPRGSVPTISVDEEVLVGFSPDALESRISRAAKRRTGS